ncbi:MAG: sensor histidine kinase [Chitinophagaceae bacterium]|nr:sensor histidine kinase [Chitinophagaceae bacterium]
MKSFLLFIYVFFVMQSSFVAAQITKESDSLRTLFLQEKNDSIRTEKQFQYVGSLLRNDKNFTAAKNELLSIRNSKVQLKFSTTEPWLYFYDALILYYHTQYLPSIILLEKAKLNIGRADESTGILNCAAKVYNLTGLNYSNINDWENAQINYQNAINSYEKINDSAGVSLIYMNMAYIFIDYQDWLNAAVSLQKSLKFMGAGGNKNRRGITYSTLAEVYCETGREIEAAIYLRRSDSLLKLYKTVDSYLLNYLAKGEFYYLKRRFDDALKYSIPAINYARQWNDSSFVVSAFELTARIYRGKKDYRQAFDYLSAGMAIADKFNYLALRKINLLELKNIFTETKQYQKALAASEKLIGISDSLNKLMNNNRRIISDASYESDKKEKKISTLKQENELQTLRIKQNDYFNYFLLGSIIGILILLFLSYRYYRQKQKFQQQRITELETQQQLTATEAVLKGEEQERTRLAQDLHDGLGGMLSGIKFSLNTMKGNLVMSPDNQQAFERSMDMLDSSIQEMRRVAHNMMPEALVKFGLDTALKDFCNDINQSGALQVSYQSFGFDEVKMDQTTAITIYRIVQELIHNTMKHAKAATAIVQVSKEYNRLSITVEDDGKGFDVGLLKKSAGMGWHNIKSRIEFLKGRLDIQAEEEKGTSVHIELDL